MNVKLKKWQHSLLAVALTLLLFGILYFTIVHPAVSSRLNFYNRINELEYQYHRFSIMSEESSAIHDEIQTLEESEISDSGFIEEKGDSLAAADLQSHLRNIIARAGGTLVSTQVVTSKTQDSYFPNVTVKVHFRGDVEMLAKVLEAIESSNPVLTSTNLLIQNRNISNRRTNKTGGYLEIRFDATAYIFRIASS